ncbi:MAG: nucleoside-diphosphate kinase, partial [Patescibacteria group bacterium]
MKERTLVIIKPDAFQRGLLGEILSRFEHKGLKIVGLKMVHLSDVLLDEHYDVHKNKPFFNELKRFMKTSPCVVLCLEGLEAVSVVRLICGPTASRTAPPGTIRGDFSMSGQATVVHASDSIENAKREINLFFAASELFEYSKCES